MPESSDYKSALKLGKRAFRQCVSEGRYPYLPVLDDFLTEERLHQRVDLGLMQIPMELVVGTRAAGRTMAFAENYMPLMPEDSEFAAKWERLCEAHLDEGIRDPVKVYEYLNRYYVEEGNKRVSVLRYFGAVSIYARVIRVMPERLEDHPLYEEYLAFNSATRVNYVEFTKPGSYLRLQELVGKEPGSPWTDEERQRFASSYHIFRRAYEANGGNRLATTPSDAMLAYLEVFGYPSIRTVGAAQLKKNVAKIWEEIALLAEPEPVELKLQPEPRESKLLTKVLPKREPKVLRVAFVHDQNPDLSGWTYGHELGRDYVQRVFEGKIQTTAYFNALDDDPSKVLDQVFDDGNTVVFTTSPRLLPASLQAAVKHPEAIILNCSLNAQHRYIRTYYARMYEAKFIAGIIAGALAGSDDVGYVCDYPIYGQVAGINAFAIGVQVANPWVRVHLEWSSVEDGKAAEERLVEQGLWIISSQDMARLKEKDIAPFGLTILTKAGAVNLASPVWQWGVYYETLIRQILDGTIQADYVDSTRALNYYWGMSAGVVEMRYADELLPATRKIALFMERAIRAGLCKPFRGPLTDQAGNEVIGSDQSLSPEQIINMAWLNENVIGEIPAWEDLSDCARMTVGVAGVAMG